MIKAPEFTRGCCYITNFNVSDAAKTALKDKLNSVAPQPDFTDPNFDAEGIWRRDIPGLTPLTPGVPFCFQHVLTNDKFGSNSVYDPSKTETRVCFHTPGTASQYSGHKEVFGWLNTLEKNIFGDPEVKEMPIWCGLSRNLRSSECNPTHPYDGSFSIAHTVEERGRGVVVVASQGLGERGMFRLNQITTYAGKVSEFFLRRTLSALEFADWETFNLMNNVPTIGGCRLHTGLQLNHSTGVEQLGNLIGQVQGNLHPDPKDLIISYTCFIVMVRFPKGT